MADPGPRRNGGTTMASHGRRRGRRRTRADAATGPLPRPRRLRATALLPALALLPRPLPRVDAFPPVAPSKISSFDAPSDRRYPTATALGGIKGFRSWFESTFPSAVVTIDPERDGGGGNQKKTKNKRKKGPSTAPEAFDHVLIDANQYLHTTLRSAYNKKFLRSKRSINSDMVQDDDVLPPDVVEHSLLLFMKELNRITRTTAVPRKSLVIALDGSPGAAKLETQRRRRSSIYKKAEAQERQAAILTERGWRDVDFGFHKVGKSIEVIATKHRRERVSLNITPGTAYAAKVTDALLYFAYQYVARFPGVRVYLSPSCVHGEGEVKLLDYLVHGHDGSLSWRHVGEDETVAIIGGDSDLVPMGLVVPPAIAHDLHVILPGKKNKSLVVSVWETSRAVARLIEGTAVYGKRKSRRKKRRSLALGQIRQARIDTALLIILNGNDYLPKLRGCKGFDPFFNVYLDVLWRTWPKGEGGIDSLGPEPFLIGVDDRSDELYLNVPFALAYFRELPFNPRSADSYEDATAGETAASPSAAAAVRAPLLGTLNNLVDAKILPGPMTFETVSPSESVFRREASETRSEATKDAIDDDFADGGDILRLTLGDFHFGHESSAPSAASSKGSYTTVRGEGDGNGVISRMTMSDDGAHAGGRAYLFEVPQRSSIKSAKYRLASLALEEIFGKENVDELFLDRHGEEHGEECEMPDGDAPLMGKNCAEADARAYLGGLMWNLETYHSGCCADYGYDYGRRSSPTPFELVEFLEGQHRKGRDKLKCFDLIDRTSASPLSDGLACLAAVPLQARHIVPEPYRRLVEPSNAARFEALWDSCIRPETNAFDIQLFQKKCEEEVARMPGRKEGNGDRGTVPRKETTPDRNKGRHIHVSSDCWIAMSFGPPMADPFVPPKPISSRLSPLRRNRRVRCSKVPAKTRSRRSRNTVVNGDLSEEEDSKTRWNDGDDAVQSVHDVPYSLAFRSNNSK